ncbi:hypothetical protein [Mycobacterium sp. AT1]|uniref:hypothetical protein n=1 Tax=Mycobacterium sp. AT1 TaxID=1961706 RepID=UPI001E37ABEE|nr:hypothetical protein [Mycobacterium sp. AT1]
MIVRCGCVLVIALVAGCAPYAEPPAASPSTEATTTTTTTEPAPPAARTANWYDLGIGDCLADPPPVDPTIVTVTVVDCTSPHRAEVYLRAPMAVNTAIAGVVDRTCGQGLADYTGHTVDEGTYATTYLIDSNQNRTSSNPTPSTVICLLEAPGGGPLTSSARR